MKTAVMHYSVPPVIGGVEAVIQAHAREFAAAGLPLTVIAGKGEASALPDGVEFIRVEEMATSHPEIEAAGKILNAGQVPADFEDLTARLVERLRPLLCNFDHVIIHNVLTKHFNLPLTVALFRLMDEGCIRHTLAWCHDLTWSSPNSSSKVYPVYPWDLLKTNRADVTYIAISSQRQDEIVRTFGCAPQEVPVIPNGVDAHFLFALSPEGEELIERLDLWTADLILLMPVRMTRAKNIELALAVTAALKALGRRPRLVLTGPPDPHDPSSSAYLEELRDLRRGLGVEAEARFVFESGPDGPGAGFTIPQEVVSELYRVADAMFMPSHREGFGMPVLEAALVGMPVISTNVPAIQDLGLDRVLIFSDSDEPERLAGRILAWLGARPEQTMRVLMRQKYTWRAIFQNQILPLLERQEA
jgi:glycosyltransferase involved in cell wall biosynthesis